MLYAVTLLDYVKATNDTQTGKDLFEIAHKQFSFFFGYLNERLQYTVPVHSMEEGGGGWHFIDCTFVRLSELQDVYAAKGSHPCRRNHQSMPS